MQWQQHKERSRPAAQRDPDIEHPRTKHGPIDSFVRTLPCSATRAGQLTDSINVVALDLRPVNCVNGLGFRQLMHVCAPGFRVPSEHHTAKNIGQRLLSNCEEAGITSKVVAIACDEAANQCAAIREDRAEVA